MKYEAILFDYGGTLGYQKEGADHSALSIPAEIQDIIRLLYGAGYRLGIISNSHRYGDRFWVSNYLQDLKLLPYFECIVSSGSWGIHKPDVNIFYRALYFMGVLPNRALMVGNSQPCDIEVAQRIGLDALYVDLDIYGLWGQALLDKLEDEHLLVRKPNLITDYISTKSRRITCQVRHLNYPVQPGDYILVGGDEKKVNRVSLDLTQEEVIDPHRDDLIEIGFE